MGLVTSFGICGDRFNQINSFRIVKFWQKHDKILVIDMLIALSVQLSYIFGTTVFVLIVIILLSLY